MSLTRAPPPPRVPLAAAAAGAGAAYAAVVVGTALCGCAAGTLGGFAAALLLAAALAAAALACPPGVWRLAARWAASALVVALVPASLAAEAQLALRRGAYASAAVAALPRDGLALADANFAAPAVLLRGFDVRLDLMGEGIALWPMYVPPFCFMLRRIARYLRGFAAHSLRAGREATPVSWERRGVTPGSDAAVGTFCVVPLVPSSAWDRATTAPPAWVACDNGWAGAASCEFAKNRTYSDDTADEHSSLAECLARLVQLNASLTDSRNASAPPSNAAAVLFYAAGGPLDERASWAAADAAAAAPAVRRAALSNALAVPPEAYANANVLRFAGVGQEACSACTHAGPAARHAATVAGAVVIVLLLTVAWGASLLDADAALMAGIAAEASRNASRLPRGAPEWWLEGDATRILRRLLALADTAHIALKDRLLPPKTRREAQERLTFAMQVRQLAQMKRPLESLRKRLAKPMRLTGPERAREQLFAAPREQSGHPVSKPPPRRSR